MPSALIGHTGFVGSNLASQIKFDALYNSANIAEIEGRRFNLIVCAAPSGEKWRANDDSDADLLSASRLIASLMRASASRVVLISTVDVYGDALGVTEFDPAIPRNAYGRNRLRIENVIAQGFVNYTILRLPSLFGPGLKKNVLFDLMHQRLTAMIVPNAVYQWYPVGRISRHLARQERVINLTSPPLTAEHIRNRFFPNVKIGLHADRQPHYDVRSIYPKDGYDLTVESVLTEMEAFLNGNARCL